MILPFIYLDMKLQLLSVLLLVKYGQSASFRDLCLVLWGWALMELEEYELWECGCKLTKY